MQEENKFSYRSLNQSKEKEWHFARGLNDITTAGNYAVRLYHDDLEAIGISTAECDTEHYVVAHLVVIESAATGKQQKMRTVGQTLMFTTCTNQSMKIITRICVLTPDGVLWHPWVDSKAGTDYLPTAQELNTTVGHLDNKFVYKGTGDVDIVSGGYFDKTVNDITLNLKKWGDTTGLGRTRHTIAAATEAMAGVMSAEDKKKLNNAEVVAKVEWGVNSNINDYTSSGVYYITGKRSMSDDGLPIDTYPYFTARLLVVGSTENSNSITQILSLNASGESNVFMRNCVIGDTPVWSKWGKLQQNTNVGRVASLDNFTAGGVYSGIYTGGTSHETFVLTVINNEAAATAAGSVRCISQFKYALDLHSNYSYKTRTGRGTEEIEWGDWDTIVMSAEDMKLVDKSKFFVDYAVLTGGTPSMNTTSATFTLPKIFISAREKGYIQTTEDIVITQTDKTWSTQYIVLDMSSKITRTVNSNEALVLGDKEVVIALLRWGEGVLEANFFSYQLNGKTVELKPTTSISSEVDKLRAYRDYAVITAQYPSMSTSNKQFIVPAGASIYSNRSKGHIVLENDIVYGLHNGAGYVYCILDVATLESRTTSVNTADFVLGENEVILAYVNMYVGVMHGYFSKYTLDGKEVELIQTTSLSSFKSEVTNTVQNLADIVYETKIIAPKMYNPPLNIQKSKIRVLDIGNSYTTDAIHYLGEICVAFNYITDFSVYTAKRGGASFKNWVDIYNNADTSSYTVGSSLGDRISEITDGTGEAGDGSIFRDALKNGKWDLIIIHQVSTYATDFDSWDSDGEAGYLKELIQILRESNPQATIGTYLVHSYRSSYSGNPEKSSLERWKKVAEATKKFCLNYGIDFVIPYGTAVQNLRATSLSDDNEFSTDGTHLADGLGDYVAACCYWQALFAPRTGISIVGNTYRKTDLDESTAGVKNITDETAPVAQKAAMWAAYNWYTVNVVE